MCPDRPVVVRLESTTTEGREMEHVPGPRIRPALTEDRDAILSLLGRSGLPVEDLAGRPGPKYLVAEEDGSITGCVGIELLRGAALVRSLAVEEASRGAGTGTRLFEAAESLCRRHGAGNAYLLTLTAEPFFAHRGYRRIAREAAPESIAKTTEFASVCPVSSAFMTKRL